ncbi:hypothetical protein F2Q69_00005946 [Brassica cretica]|uniref:CCHC-type domain-containing protein n=1 Tax=Brassica cretica TaxID=69181 RepID=A0A8S9P0G7_BRACR|nr:hypothetical protein F2Q69_00005946 [Brassica cretica]
MNIDRLFLSNIDRWSSSMVISVQPQAYLGEEDQLRPSSPLVRGRVKLEVSSPVHSVSWFIQPCSGGTQVLSNQFQEKSLVSDCSYRTFDNDGDANSLVSLPGDRVLHDDAVSDCSYRTFDNDGDANSLVSVTLRRETLYFLDGRNGQQEMPPRGALFGRRGGPNLPISISSSSDSSPPSTPAPLPTPSFEATPLGSSIGTDPSEGSYDQTPVHMPLSPDTYFMDIEVAVVHDSPVHGDHPAAPASPAAHIPPAPATPTTAAQPEPTPTDPAIIALLELMAEMVNLQHQALNAQLEFHRLADLVERAVNVEEAIAAERASSSHSAQPRRPSIPFQPQPHSAMQQGRGGRVFRGALSGGPRPRTSTCFTCGQLGHVRRDCPNVGQFQSAGPSHITCFTCGEQGHYATLCPHTHLSQPFVSSTRPDEPANPPLPLPPTKRQDTAHRAYALELPEPSRPP